MKDLSIIIPCYNEQECILPLFEKLQKLISLNKNLEIIIVDNGSTDDSSKIINNHSLYKENLINLVTVEKKYWLWTWNYVRSIQIFFKIYILVPRGFRN